MNRGGAHLQYVLVTGCAGFIGSHLCEALLKQGLHVVGVDNLDPYYDISMKRDNLAACRQTADQSGARFEFVQADICDDEAVLTVFDEHNVEAVVHLAALAGVRPSIAQPVRYARVNVQGTAVLLEACRRHAVRRFVFASSSSVYGNNKKVPFSEDDAVDNPISPYAATKKAGELLCHTYHALYGMRMACLRFFTVYGERQRPDLAIHKFTRLMMDGMEIPVYGQGDTARDYTYINDIISGVSSALNWTKTPGAACEIFNLGNAKPILLNDMIKTIERALGTRARIKRLPAQSGDVHITFADISKAGRELGFDPVTSFEEGIGRFVAWIRTESLTMN